MAIIDDTDPPKKEPSLVLQIALLAGLTVAAIGIGWVSGLYLGSKQPGQPANEEAGPPKASETVLSETWDEIGVVYLEPVTTNLAGPSNTWVRIEMALVFEGEADPMIAQAIQQDVLAYLRTVKVHQVEGASGFQHLKTDLEERAALRSDGKVTRILIRTLLFE